MLFLKRQSVKNLMKLWDIKENIKTKSDCNFRLMIEVIMVIFYFKVLSMSFSTPFFTKKYHEKNKNWYKEYAHDNVYSLRLFIFLFHEGINFLFVLGKRWLA